MKTFSTYYSGYKEIAAVVLNYEEFLHNVNTREMIATCIAVRTNFIRKEIEAAIKEREIVDIFTPEELANIFMGSLDRDLLNRRIQNDNKTHIQVVTSIVDKLADMLRIREDS